MHITLEYMRLAPSCTSDIKGFKVKAVAENGGTFSYHISILPAFAP